MKQARLHDGCIRPIHPADRERMVFQSGDDGRCLLFIDGKPVCEVHGVGYYPDRVQVIGCRPRKGNKDGFNGAEHTEANVERMTKYVDRVLRDSGLSLTFLYAEEP